MDYETKSSSQKIIRLTNIKGVVNWMLFSEARKTVRSDKYQFNYSDRIEIQLRAIGSFDRRENGGAVVMQMRGQASGSFANTVNFSDGYIVVEDPWKELRIGTYMMNHLVAWAKENYPNYSAVGIRLVHSQAYDENKERRNRFYARFGFRFKWDDENTQREGHLVPELRILDLSTTDKWRERVEEFSVDEAVKVKEIFSEADRL